MKVGLWQIDCSDGSEWHADSITALLKEALPKELDLVVFPECFPFRDCRETPTIDHARDSLRRASRKSRGPAFIAGGYVVEGEDRRNMVFLLEGGEIRGEYRKRWPWPPSEGPDSLCPIEPGERLERFSWSRGACIPLICADVFCPESPENEKLYKEARRLGAGPTIPIIVCAYGAGVRGPKWSTRLRDWADACQAPVVLCNPAGRDRDCSEFGHGGSRVYWPDGHSTAKLKRGLYVHDL